MKVWALGAAVLLLLGVVTGCGSNSATVAVTVTAPGVTTGATATVVTNGTLQFSGSVTGVSATSVYWQICLPAPTATVQPTTCTTIPGLTTSPAKVLTGYGTITQTGLYSAPPTVPSPNNFVVMAISTISPYINTANPPLSNTYFGIINMQIDSGVRVQVSPSSATVGTLETTQFTATVTGTTNQSVTWSAAAVAGGNATDGFISNSGLYTAPSTAVGSVTITATSAADTSKTGTATVTVSNAADPTLTSLDPLTAAQGSVEQNVYLLGSNFFSTDTVVVVPPGQTAAPVPTVFISSTLLRATIPGDLLTTAGQVQIEVERQNGSFNIPGPLNLLVSPVRPAVVSASPDSVSQNGAGANVTLTGGFFSPSTSVQFNGSTLGVATTVASSRQLSVAIPTGDLATPGLYPIVVRNSGIPAGQAAMSAVNLAVTPTTTLLPGAPVSTLAVGSNPSAVAIDYASETAVVVNTGNGAANGTVSLVNLGTNPPTLTSTVTVGKSPTGVAIDDLLSPHLALVVNSGDQTVSAINLTTQQVTSVLSVAIGPTGGSAAGPAPLPYSVGINSLSHHAVVAYESFNEATILDLSTGAPVIIEQVGGDVTAPLGTGTTPAVAVDPRLNWAIITPGGGGAPTTSIVDLGRNASAGDGGRTPQVIGSFALAATGVGINTETHQALLTDPNAGTLTSFSLLDNTVDTISFTNNGVVVNQLGYIAAAADPLENLGIAVNSISSSASIVDLERGIVLQTVNGLGTLPQAVAVDPGSNQAVVVNQGSGSISVLSLGSSLNPLQIVEDSPATLFTSAAPLALTITGFGFNGGSQVLLDGTAVATASVATNGRQIVATVPASMLGAARRFAVQVQNAGGVISNVTYLTVIQPIVVGNSPVGVAVDTDRDLAVVTNSGSGSVSLVALVPTTPVGVSQVAAGAVGTIGSPITVGANPLGVAVLPRLGLALIANSGSNNVSLVDLTQTYGPQTVPACLSGFTCSVPTGVAINWDNGGVAITEAGIANNTSAPSSVSFGTITAPTTTAAATLGSFSLDSNVDQNPGAVAIDPQILSTTPSVSYAAVGTSSETSSVQIINIATETPQRISGFQIPNGIVFDPVNQVFLVANSLDNTVVIVDPNTLIQTPLRVGINPTSLAYNFQTSTLITSNLSSSTLSVLSYTCPPPATGGVSPCVTPQVRAVLALGSSQQFSIDVDPKLNLAVVADQSNNRVLLVPLPQ